MYLAPEPVQTFRSRDKEHLDPVCPSRKQIGRRFQALFKGALYALGKGEIMALKVLITRKFRPNTQKQAYKTLMQLRSSATLEPGYISGETLIGADDPNKILVISAWSNRKRWEEWQANQKRAEIARNLEPLLESPEQVECFLLGEKVPEWVDMA